MYVKKTKTRYRFEKCSVLYRIYSKCRDVGNHGGLRSAFFSGPKIVCFSSCCQSWVLFPRKVRKPHTQPVQSLTFPTFHAVGTAASTMKKVLQSSMPCFHNIHGSGVRAHGTNKKFLERTITGQIPTFSFSHLHPSSASLCWASAGVEF